MNEQTQILQCNGELPEKEKDKKRRKRLVCLFFCCLGLIIVALGTAAALVLLQINGIPILTQNLGCPGNFTTEPTFGTHCYRRLGTTNLRRAAARCANLGADSFAYPKSQEENEFLFETFVKPTGRPLALAINDKLTEDMYRIVHFLTTNHTGEVVEYFNWADGQPDSLCPGYDNTDRVMMTTETGKWDDVSIGCLQYADALFVCQTEMQ